MKPTVLITNVRPFGAAPADVRIVDGTIAAIGAHRHASAPGPGETLIDGEGALLLPGFVEGHTHLDKTTWSMPWYRNEVGARLVDRIENERRWRAASGHDAARASRALALAFLRAGTTRLRTHVDIDTDAGLRHLEGVMATRDALSDVLDMQIVAFPQSGVLGRAGTRELLDAALALGADVLGALDPAAIDGDPAASLDLTFALATKHQKPIDIHLH
jgi:cytosine/adenosine deaminase-related metal-dependent hydrolase